MNSPHGKMQRGSIILKGKDGFTLLEIVIVLGLIAVIVAWITLNVSTVDTEKKLLKAVDHVELMLKRARSIAVTQQRAYQVVIGEGEVEMMPGAMKGDKKKDEIWGEDETAKGLKNVEASEKMDTEVKYEIKRWRDKQWVEILGDKKVKLVFSPSGLVEPISIRVSLGKSWILHRLSPLTAGVRDEEMSIQDE